MVACNPVGDNPVVRFSKGGRHTPGHGIVDQLRGGNGIPRKRIHCFNKIGTDLYLKSLPAWREEAKSGDEEVKYGQGTRT